MPRLKAGRLPRSGSTIHASASGVPGDESHQRVVGIPLVEQVAADDQVEPDLRVCRGYLAHREAIETAMVGTQLLGVLFAIFMRFPPLLLLVARRLGVGHSLCKSPGSGLVFIA